MRHLLVLMFFVTIACSSAPITKNSFDDSTAPDKTNETSTVELIQACISSTAITIMSVGDSRAVEGLCRVTPESKAMWDRNWAWKDTERTPPAKENEK